MKNILFIGLCFLLFPEFCCTPDRTDNPAQNIKQDITALTAKIDSLTDADKDGLDFQPLNTGNYREIPEELTELLNRDFTDWTLPHFSTKKLKKLPRTTQGPLFLKADFNADGKTDYAVQVLNNDSLKVVTYLMDNNGATRKYILESHPLGNNALNKPDSLYLTLRQPTKNELRTKKIKTPENPVLVTDGKRSRAYNFKDKQVLTPVLLTEN